MENVDIIIKKLLLEQRRNLIEILKIKPANEAQREAIIEAQAYLDRICQILEAFGEK